MVGDADGAGGVERGAGTGQVADGAVDRAAAELDRPGLQHAMPCLVASFVHGASLHPKLTRTLSCNLAPGKFTRGQTWGGIMRWTGAYCAGWNVSVRAICQASRKRGSSVPSSNSPGRSDG
ncbi:hypothetical protein ACVWW4_005723 [Bradyrhizobium sp. LB7.1]